MMKKLLIMILLLALPMESAYGQEMDFAAETMGEVSMSGSRLDEDILKLSVQVEQIGSPVLGTAFHLLYPEDNLAFLRYQPGEFLERGGDPFYLVKDDGGRIYFGQTLRSDDRFPIGKGLVVDFYFQILREAAADLSFENGVISTLDTVRQDLNNIDWVDYTWVPDQDDEAVELAGVGKTDTLSAGEGGQIAALVSMLVLALLTAYWLIKNLGKKRPDSYVNFK